MKKYEIMSRELEMDMDELMELFSTDTLDSMPISTVDGSDNYWKIIKETLVSLDVEEVCSIINGIV